jgi:purine-binding chemotaxis protein CheW
MDMKDYFQFTVIMILDVSGRIMGLVVDAVSDVITLNREDVKPRPHFSNGISTEFIAGMGIKDNKFSSFSMWTKCFSDEELNIRCV